MSDTVITFFAAGTPKGQPRPRAFARKFGNKYQARVYDAGTAEGWKSMIAIAARPHLPPVPLAGPLEVSETFCFQRPKGHFRTGKRACELRPEAPECYHTQKPDRDNLDKAVMDCLTAIGMFGDDCQVCGGEIRKFWCAPGERSGVKVEIRRLP